MVGSAFIRLDYKSLVQVIILKLNLFCKLTEALHIVDLLLSSGIKLALVNVDLLCKSRELILRFLSELYVGP